MSAPRRAFAWIPAIGSLNSNTPQVSSTTLAHPPPTAALSRSRAILKFLTAKIRPAAPTPPPSPLPPADKPRFAPAPPDSQAAREKREAALRERGLLPPLKPNKDLSRLEREQDRYLPVHPVEHAAVTITSATGVETITAANLIKKEWEAKNPPGEDDERERLTSFRFGAISSPAHESETHNDVAESPSRQQDGANSPDRARCEGDSAGRRSTERDHGLGYPSPTMVPLPPSPTPSLCAKTSLELVPLPTESTPSLKIVSIETNLEPGPLTPIISLSPAAEEADQKDAMQGHQRQTSVSESQISLATPSLDASSHSTAASVLSPVESSPRIKTTTLTGAKNIPMIVESPIEEGPIPEASVSNPVVEELNADAQQDPLEEYQKSKARRKRRMMFGQDPSTRLTVSTSLTSMRRSVTNTLSRTKSSLTVKGQRKRDDTSGTTFLPPSPTYPLMGGIRRSLDVSTAAVPRQPVSPTLYSSANIIMETSAIEDEETRRMTELAFLG